MPITMRKEPDNLFRLDVSGLLTKADLDGCQGALVEEMARLGSVKLLFVLNGFEGWDPGGDWNDLTFYVRYGSAIDRIAIVGDERWRSQTMMFAGADLRSAPVEFFVAGDEPKARAWLSV